MPGDACVVCGNSRRKAPQLSYHCFPSGPERHAIWLQAFQLTEEHDRPPFVPVYQVLLLPRRGGFDTVAQEPPF